MKRLGLVAVVALSACSGSGNGSGGGAGGSSGGGGSSTGGGSATGGGTSTGGGSAATGGGTATGGGSASGGGGGSSATVTWYKDVLPVVQNRCLSCHVTGGIGAFSMESYATAQPQAAAMAADTASRKMPPWPIDDSCGGPFRGSLHLTQAEIDTFAQWAAQGAAEGNPADAPPPPDAGTPFNADLTLTPANAYTPPSGVTDDYHCFIVDPQLQQNAHVVAYEIVPGVSAEVHHVGLFAVDRAQAMAMDSNGTGWTCFGGTGTLDQNLIGAWTPGAGVVRFPEGTGLLLDSSKTLVMQVHYNLQNGVRAPDSTTAKVALASGSVTEASLITLVDTQFQVPPMAMGYTHSKTFSGTNKKVWGVFGHLHTQGHEVKVTAGNECLMDIPNWDFHWQEQYFYQSPIQLAGQSLTLSCTWNNTTPNMLTFGEDTSQEMCVSLLYVTP